MSQALTPPFLIACLVLCLAGVAKLRAPQTAAAALGLRGWNIRVFAGVEFAIGAVCAIHPTRAGGWLVAALYATFALVAVVLMRRRVACGCFGDNDFRVTRAHVIASELLAASAAATTFVTPRGLGWLASQPVPVAVSLAAGIGGAVLATALVYTSVPRAWAAWSGE